MRVTLFGLCLGLLPAGPVSAVVLKIPSVKSNVGIDGLGSFAGGSTNRGGGNFFNSAGSARPMSLTSSFNIPGSAPSLALKNDVSVASPLSLPLAAITEVKAAANDEDYGGGSWEFSGLSESELGPMVSLERDFRVFSNEGSQSTVFRHNDDPVLVKRFDLKGVEEKHVRNLIHIAQAMTREGNSIVPMELVRLEEGGWGIRMPLVDGVSAGWEISRLSPDGLIVDREASRLQKESFKILEYIDDFTDGLADRRGGLFSEAEDFENFIRAREDRKVVNIDPIDMRKLQKRMAPAAPPEEAPVAPSGALARLRGWFTAKK